VELGDVAEYGSFDAFQQHMGAARLATDWAPEEEVLHVSYRSGGDTLEMGVRPTYQHPDREYPVTFGTVSPTDTMAYQRVNGQWPWPDRGIDLDCPLGQMGKAALLQKGGAVLRTLEGQMAMLRIEPISGTYEGVNPFIDPQPFELRTPEGVVIRSEGPIGCTRITVRPKENALWVDYHLPPPEGDRGAELLQEDARASKRGGAEVEARLSHYFRPDVDLRNARAQSARALLVTGLEAPPKVVLNGKTLGLPCAKLTMNGAVWLRVPIVIEQ
jgi:hypothetical protein